MSRIEAAKVLEENRLNTLSSMQETSLLPIMAKPGIPVEKPKRREVPDVTYPSPKRISPPLPTRTPREPVPVRR